MQGGGTGCNAGNQQVQSDRDNVRDWGAPQMIEDVYNDARGYDETNGNRPWNEAHSGDVAVPRGNDGALATEMADAAGGMAAFDLQSMANCSYGVLQDCPVRSSPISDLYIVCRAVQLVCMESEVLVVCREQE